MSGGPEPIRTRALAKRFPSGAGLLPTDLLVREGEVFGFLGPNGAGKTTTIRLLLDLLRPDSGTVEILGQDVREKGGALRSRIGFLPGDLRLFPDADGNRMLSLLADLSGREPVARDEVLDRLGFDRRALGRKIKSYSTGMRQAIGITAAFQHDPELLILDEPTTGLDPLVRRAFLKLVRDSSDKGRTVFLSSHVLDEIEQTADRVGFISKGRLRLVQPVEELRRERPRRVRILYEDGRAEEILHSGPIRPLIARLAAEPLSDLEIRGASLDEVFRAVVGEDDT